MKKHDGLQYVRLEDKKSIIKEGKDDIRKSLEKMDLSGKKRGDIIYHHNMPFRMGAKFTHLKKPTYIIETIEYIQPPASDPNPS